MLHRFICKITKNIIAIPNDTKIAQLQIDFEIWTTTCKALGETIKTWLRPSFGRKRTHERWRYGEGEEKRVGFIYFGGGGGGRIILSRSAFHALSSKSRYTQERRGTCSPPTHKFLYFSLDDDTKPFLLFFWFTPVRKEYYQKESNWVTP